MFMDDVRRNRPVVLPPPPPPPPPKPPPAPAPAARPPADRSAFEPPRNKPVALQSPPTGEKDPEAQVRQVAQQVDAANARGGSAEAARVLKERTLALPPELATRAVQASKPTIDRITADLGGRAKSADGGMDTKDKDAKAFDAVVGDLAAVTSHASTATDGSGPAAVAAVSESVTRNISSKNIGRFDEALGQAVGNAQGAELAVEVSRQLQVGGRGKQADDILENVQVGAGQLEKRFTDLADKVKASNDELGWLVKNYGDLSNPDAVQRATDDFRSQHPEYQELEAFGGAATRAMNTLHRLPPEIQGLSHADDVTEAGKKFTREKLADTQLTQSGRDELARLVKDKHENVLDHLGDVGVPAGKSAEFYQQVGENVVKAAISDAGEAAALGDTQRMREALDGLERRSGLVGVKASELHDVRLEIDKIADPSTTPAERWNATMRFQNKVNNIEGFQANPALLNGLRLLTVTGGAIATIQSGKKAIDDPSVLNFTKAASDLVGLGSSGTQFVAGVTGHQAFASRIGSGTNVLGKAGRVAGFVGVALDSIGVIQDLGGHNYAKAGFGAANVLGGAALIAGGAWTGPGIALVAGAAIIGSQYSRVQESNKHENPTTVRFIQQLGITNPEVARHLSNADDHGRSAGPVFTALADHLNVPHEEFFRFINTLPPDRVLELVKAAHGVDPDKEGRFPVTAENDHNLIPPPPGGYTTYPDRTPHSLNGLESWLRLQGYDAPGVS